MTSTHATGAPLPPMRHTRITRLMARSAASGRRTARALSGHGEAPAPVAAWRGDPSGSDLVAFAGDSLASRFPAALLEELHPGILRRGWAGETAVALRARIAEVLERRPTVLLLQTGTNDLLRGTGTDDLLTTWDGILGDCRATTPETAILLLGLPPVTPARLDPRTVRAANIGLGRLADEVGATIVDTYPTLAAPDGTPAPGTTTDGVHLTVHGYRVVADLLRPPLAAAITQRSSRTPASRVPTFPITFAHPS